jgi:hypothetical protein
MQAKARIAVVAMLLLGIPGVSLAWDGVATGVISNFAVTDGGNQGFRISLANVTSLCTGDSSGVAYLNATDSNYNVYVAALLYAKSMGSTIGVYTTLDSRGACHIGYIAVG